MEENPVRNHHSRFLRCHV